MAKFDFSKIAERLSSIGGFGAGAMALLGGGYMLQANCIYTVDAGHRAILFHRLTGVGDKAYAEGVHLKLPWFERPIIFDVKARPHLTTSLTGSRDLQMVNISLRALCKPDVMKLREIYRSLGPDYEEKVLQSIVHEVLKSVVAQYNASELIIQRETVSQMIRKRLVQRSRDFHILLDDVAITHLNFSPEYEKAVESKQVAQQQAEKARYLVLKAQEEKKRVIIHAEGEQKSAAMIGDAIKSNPGFVELRRISVAKEVAGLLAKSANRMVLSTESLMLNIMGNNRADDNLDKGSAKKK